ncbi:Monothiol glutaredoxin-related like protein [Aduncisulcus paluster]|uniref:Monothiol glutaredoxin-related like protein n=1 Tax=Aduncisulcus paluster TaxID=2918883 RepID=A0ABQ5KBC5_9EUKA|nr:Monothiol glutaredoxin-related like protein [Aduncisulcus paluster]
MSDSSSRFPLKISVSIGSTLNLRGFSQEILPQTTMDPELEKKVLKEIDTIVKGHKNVLFMKGTPENPKCGFSRLAALILDFHKVDYFPVDVLERPELREMVKKYSKWPTYPQLLVDGTVIGGTDILVELHESDELDEVLSSPQEIK